MDEPVTQLAVWRRVTRRMARSADRLASSPRFIVVAFGVMVAFVLVQYSRFGTDMYLGWDSSYYVYLSGLIDQFGLGTMLRVWSFPQLYVLLLWTVGHGIGSTNLAERLLPLLWFAVLLVAYERMTYGMTKDRRLTNLALLLAPITASTITVFATLNRTLMSFSLAMVALVLVARLPPNLLRPRRGNLVLFLCLLGVAATELETYAVFGLAIVLSFLFRRQVREFVEALVFMTLPLAVVLPISISFVAGYLPSQSFPSAALALTPITVLVYGTGSPITGPFLFLGAWFVYKKARTGDRLAIALMGWLLALGVLFIILATGIIQLPPLRVLYLFPLAPVLAVSIPEAESLWTAWRRSRPEATS